MLDARPVEGTWRRLRWGANAILIAILFAIPWIRIDGEPLVLLDVPARKFHVFGMIIFPQELYFLWLILAGLALSLFFFTALAGRLWCGWACPQTVFTDVLAAVARRIQGWQGFRRPERIAWWRKAATHAVWILLCGVIAFHLVGYFRPTYDMVAGLLHAEVRASTLGFLLVVTGLTYFDFGIVRQTFCKYLCPYARFQGVLFDRDTLVVGYDSRRGEPRGKRTRKDAGANQARGDCVDCGLCVQVCPTGIDIRDGLQLECIACTQCIDACNGVMEKLDRPPNLIGYRSLVGLEGVRPARILRPRVAIYGVLLVAVGVAFAGLLEARVPASMEVLRNRTSLYSRTADGRVSNAFELHIENRARTDRVFRIRIDPADRYELVAGLNPLIVPAASVRQASVFVLAQPGAPGGTASRELHFVLEPLDDLSHPIVRSARFVSPGNGVH
jgi:cytochrome c oxidase accessory protein FixG